MANEYILHYADDSIKSPLQINPRTIDRSASSLVLFGKGVQNYGDIAQENLLHLLENHCSDISPINPTEGQLWYDSLNNLIKVCIGFEINPALPPVNPADPDDPHYLHDVNGLRIPQWLIVGGGSNGVGNKTISTEAPVGGADGDIWYQI